MKSDNEIPIQDLIAENESLKKQCASYDRCLASLSDKLNKLVEQKRTLENVGSRSIKQLMADNKHHVAKLQHANEKLLGLIPKKGEATQAIIDEVNLSVIRRDEFDAMISKARLYDEKMKANVSKLAELIEGNMEAAQRKLTEALFKGFPVSDDAELPAYQPKYKPGDWVIHEGKRHMVKMATFEEGAIGDGVWIYGIASEDEDERYGALESSLTAADDDDEKRRKDALRMQNYFSVVRTIFRSGRFTVEERKQMMDIFFDAPPDTQSWFTSEFREATLSRSIFMELRRRGFSWEEARSIVIDSGMAHAAEEIPEFFPENSINSDLEDTAKTEVDETTDDPSFATALGVAAVGAAGIALINSLVDKVKIKNKEKVIQILEESK